MARQIVNRLTMLSLITRNHVNRLLQQVKIEVLVGICGRVVEISIDEGLRACIE